ENVAKLVTELGKGYTHIRAASATTGEYVLPRAAELLEVSMFTDIISVDGPKTFKRPIYAGNAIATVESGESIVLATVRGTAFDAVAAEGGSAAVEAAASTGDAGIFKFINE